MNTYPASLSLRIRAASQQIADAIARAAATVLRETFNDDGRLARCELIPTDSSAGPWVSERPRWTDPRSTRHVYDSRGCCVARIGFADARQSEAEAIANAELVAAAPTLREALAAAVAYVELYTGNGCQQRPPTWAITADGFDAETIAARGRLALARAGDARPGPLPANSEPTPARVYDRATAPELFTVFAGNAQFEAGGRLLCAGPMLRGDTLANLDWSDAGEVENFQDGADVMERICTLLGAKFRDPGERAPAPAYSDLNDEPPLYVVFNSHAFFACADPAFAGDLQAAYIEDDGSIDWTDGVVDVDPYAIARDEEETIAAICACVGARYPGN